MLLGAIVLKGCSMNILEKSWDWSMVLVRDYQSEEYIRFLEIYSDPQLHNSEDLIAKMSGFLRGLLDNPRVWERIKELRESRDVADAHGP